MLLFGPQLHELPEWVKAAFAFSLSGRIRTKEMLYFFSPQHCIVHYFQIYPAVNECTT